MTTVETGNTERAFKGSPSALAGAGAAVETGQKAAPLNITARPKRIVIIVENLPVPFDRRVWSEATTLARAGYEISIISPKGMDATASFEIIDGIRIYRHWLPKEGDGALGYLAEYGTALFFEFVLAFRILLTRGFDAIHACNPPDLIFLVGGFFKFLLGKKFIFDHHDINPELYEAKFGKRDFLWRVMTWLERMTFATADISIATNESYRAIALGRGGMAAGKVFVVRSGPNLARVRARAPDAKWKNGKKHLVAYVGVIGKQEGLDLLLEAATHMRAARGRDDFQFAVVGDGPELANIRAQASARKLEDCFTFTGRVDDETLFTILSTADVCVNPDRPNAMNDKSTMNKIMEYMAMGKAIVQFDLAEGRFSAMEASLYARNTDASDFGEKILELLDHPEKREAMGAKGRARVFTSLAWENEAPSLLNAYSSLKWQHER